MASDLDVKSMILDALAIKEKSHKEDTEFSESGSEYSEGSESEAEMVESWDIFSIMNRDWYYINHNHFYVRYLSEDNQSIGEITHYGLASFEFKEDILIDRKKCYGSKREMFHKFIYQAHLDCQFSIIYDDINDDNIFIELDDDRISVLRYRPVNWGVEINMHNS